MNTKKTFLKTFIGITLILIWLVVFNFALFFGLQISPILGNIGVIVAVILLVAFIVLFKRILQK